MSDPGLVLGNLTFFDNANPMVKQIIQELNEAMDGEDQWRYVIENWEWSVVGYTPSLHARASVFSNIIRKYEKYIEKFALSIHAIREPFEELLYEDGKFKIDHIEG